MTLFVNKQKNNRQRNGASCSQPEYRFCSARHIRISDEDFSVLYNKALCCFMVKWHDECYRLLCEAEQLMSGRNITHEAELPEAFLRYDHAEGHPFHPMPQGIPVCLAYRQLLLLKAETAFRLHLYSEVKSISACLVGKYKHIEKLINNITDNDNL